MGCFHPDNATETLSRTKSRRKNSNARFTVFNGVRHREQENRQNMPLSTLHGVKGFWFKAFDKVGIENVNFFGKVMVNHQEINDLKQKVADLQRELQKQIELKETYFFQAKSLQTDLRNCLHLAQEQGFIHLVARNESNSSAEDPFESIEELEREHVPNCPASCLASLHQQARQNGWQINDHEIELHEQIGKGATSDIFRGTWRGLDVAVKRIRPDYFEMHEEVIEWFCQEVEILARQRHPHVLQLMGACLSNPTTAWLVTELLSSRTLTEWLYGHKDRHYQRTSPLPSFCDRLRIGMEISQGMQYLHEQTPKVLHRDLKLSNIFLDDNLHAKIGDFGHARFLAESEFALTGETGTYIYMAPEVIRSQPYNEKCDVYSYAIILNELVTGLPPYIDSNFPPPKIAFEVAEGKMRPTLPQHEYNTSNHLINLICSAWDPDPSKRPTFKSITCTLRQIKEDVFG